MRGYLLNCSSIGPSSSRLSWQCASENLLQLVMKDLSKRCWYAFYSHEIKFTLFSLFWRAGLVMLTLPSLFGLRVVEFFRLVSPDCSQKSVSKKETEVGQGMQSGLIPE